MSAEREPALLLVDDEEHVLTLIRQLFRGELPVLTARSGEEALALVAAHRIGVVVADQRMTGMSGTDLLARIADAQPHAVRILLTAYTDTTNLLEAINAGRVYHFVAKPWDNQELAMVIRRAMETHKLFVHNLHLADENARLVRELGAANSSLETENRVLRREADDRYRLGAMIGQSPVMHEAFRLIQKASGSTATVLLRGETGTGKELAAACIHDASPRRQKAFVAVNCGAMPDGLLESELFGHVKGAFTGAIRERRGLFEEANGGTIFLDEIGEMSTTMQVKVLRVVEDGVVRPVGGSQGVKVDVRLVCATNRDLKAEVEHGTFRQDLFYRLNVFPVVMPPLRAREGDVRLLAEHFLRRYDETTGKRLGTFTPAALHCLERYAWPGNVRELKNEIERAVTLAEPGDLIDVPLLSPEVAGDPALGEIVEGDGKLFDRLERLEQLLIMQELRRHGDNRTHTARTLGISVRALQKKIGKYGLPPREG